MKGFAVTAAALCATALVVAGAEEAAATPRTAVARPVPSLAPAATQRLWKHVVQQRRHGRLLATTDCRPLRAVFYAATDWIRLATKLAANASPCAQYYVSVPPLVGDKTQPRGDQAWRIRALGSNFHALAEVNIGSWGSWVTASSSTWYAAGVEARRRMALAGYDVAAGDSWVVNEVSSAARRGDGNARANLREFLRGLYTGDGAQTRGAVFITGMSQSTSELSVYQARLQDWYEDGPFWDDMSRYLNDWSQELYGDVRNYAVPGADVPTRRDSLNEYLQHELALARVAPAGAASAKTFLETAYSPLANAAWQYDAAFGWTNVPSELMQHFVSAQTYALRNFSAAAAQDHGGFAWAPKNLNAMPSTDFVAQTDALLDRLAAAIHDSAQPSADTGLGACASVWCGGDLDGASFNAGWSSFATWKPSKLVFTSAAQEIPVNAASAQLTVELRTYSGVALPAGVAVPVTLASSSSSGRFSTSAGGPWSSTLTVSIPNGVSSVGFYYSDATAGAPTITASTNGKVPATQEESVVVRAKVSSIAYAPSGRDVRITTRLVDASGAPLAGASITYTVSRNAIPYANGSGTTGADGSLSQLIVKAPSGCYTTQVKSLSTTGWDGVTPPNRYCK